MAFTPTATTPYTMPGRPGRAYTPGNQATMDQYGMTDDSHMGAQHRQENDHATWDAYNANPNGGMPTTPTDQMYNVSQDRSGLNAFAQEAMRQGPSKWANLAQQQNQDNSVSALNRGAQQAATSGQQAIDQQAMFGGVTGGGAERASMNAANNAFAMQQDVGKQTNDNAMQININDEQNRISQLGQLPGMQNQADTFDLNQAAGMNAFAMGNYNTNMRGWAANQQANMMDPSNPNSPNYDNHSRWYDPGSW